MRRLVRNDTSDRLADMLEDLLSYLKEKGLYLKGEKPARKLLSQYNKTKRKPGGQP